LSGQLEYPACWCCVCHVVYQRELILLHILVVSSRYA
jgi:hypothetical protein